MNPTDRVEILPGAFFVPGKILPGLDRAGIARNTMGRGILVVFQYAPFNPFSFSAFVAGFLVTREKWATTKY